MATRTAGETPGSILLAVFLLILILGCLWAAVPPIVARGAANPAAAPTLATPVLEWGAVKVRAEIGFGGQFRPGRFAPLRLVVENTGPAVFHGFAGLTVVRPSVLSSGNRETYRAEVLAGSPARLELPFVIPLRSSYDRLLLQLWDQTGAQVAERQLILPQLPQQQSLWLILRYQPVTSPWLALLIAAAKRLEPDLPVITTYVNDAAQLPTDPVAFDGIDLLILDDISLRQLPQQAAMAIQAWVSRGGVLLVTAAAKDTNAGAWPWKGDFFPFGDNAANSSQAGRAENVVVSWVKYGNGKVAFWPGRLESSPQSGQGEVVGPADGASGGEETADGEAAIAEVLRLRRDTGTRPLLPIEVPVSLPQGRATVADLDGAVASVLRETPLTDTRAYLVGVLFVLYALALAAAERRARRPAGPRRWLAAQIMVWAAALTGATVFAQRENARLVRAGSQVVEVGIGSTGTPWQYMRTFVSVPNPGHPAVVSAPAAFAAALPTGAPGSWQLTWNLRQQALLHASDGVLALSWSRLGQAPLGWGWHGAPEPYLEIVNSLAETVWLLGLASWSDPVVTTTVGPNAKVTLPFPAARSREHASGHGPTVKAAASELSARLLPALLDAPVPLPPSSTLDHRDALRLLRSIWQRAQTELVSLALEEGVSSGSTRLRRDPVLLIGLGIPLRPVAGDRAAGPSERTGSILRLLALWVEPPPASETLPNLPRG